jgi:hypothetical protein
MIEKIYFIVLIIVALFWASSVISTISKPGKSDKLFKTISWVMLLLISGGLIFKILYE